MNNKKFFGLIKPDALEFAEEVIAFIIREGEFKVTEARIIQIPREDAEKIVPCDLTWFEKVGGRVVKDFLSAGIDVREMLGHDHDLQAIGRDIRGWNIEYLTKDSCVLLVIEGNQTEAQNFKTFVGPTDTRNPSTVRGFFRLRSDVSMLDSNLKGRSFYNIIHAPDEERLEYEFDIFSNIQPLGFYDLGDIGKRTFSRFSVNSINF